MHNSALLLIDIQNDYFPSFTESKMSLPDMDNACAHAERLLSVARKKGTLVIHVKHVMSSDSAPFFQPDTPGAELHGSVSPSSGEKLIEKTRPNSFIGTDLESFLRDGQVTRLTICGAMSQMCIDATVRAAVDLGFKVTVAEDACAAADIVYNGLGVPYDKVHASIMAPLAASYADVRKTSDCIGKL